MISQKFIQSLPVLVAVVGRGSGSSGSARGGAGLLGVGWLLPDGAARSLASGAADEVVAGVAVGLGALVAGAAKLGGGGHGRGGGRCGIVLFGGGGLGGGIGGLERALRGGEGVGGGGLGGGVLGVVVRVVVVPGDLFVGTRGGCCCGRLVLAKDIKGLVWVGEACSYPSASPACAAPRSR